MTMPAGWSIKTLDELVELDVEMLSAVTPRDFSFYYLDISAASQGRLSIPAVTTDFFEAPSRARKVVRRGDVLMSMVRPNLKAFALFDQALQPCIASTGFAVLRSKSETSAAFVLYSILSEDVANQIEALVTGSSYPAINSTAVRALKILAPPIDEQTKIAEILSTVDQAIEQTEALIAKQQRIKTGLMQDLLTRGIDEHGQLRTEQTHAFKDSPLGRIPVEWELATLDRLTSDVVDCPHTTPNFLPSGILVARTFNLKDGQFVGAKSYISDTEYASRVSRLEPQAGDVIFTREAPVGEAYVVPPQMKICLGQRTMQIRCKPNRLLPEFFVEFVYSEETRIRFDQMVSGTTNPHLNVSDVRSLLLRVPSVDEQNQMILRIGAVRESIQQAIKQLDKLAALKAALMQDLLTGHKRVTDLLEPTAA